MIQLFHFNHIIIVFILNSLSGRDFRINCLDKQRLGTTDSSPGSDKGAGVSFKKKKINTSLQARSVFFCSFRFPSASQHAFYNNIKIKLLLHGNRVWKQAIIAWKHLQRGGLLLITTNEESHL